MDYGKYYIPSNKRLKYKKRNKDPKEEYSLRSLVPEITGIETDEKGFEAARKRVERMVEEIQESLGLEKTTKIPHFRKEGFIQITRALYLENWKQYEKIKKKERLSEAELVELTELMKDAVTKDPDTFENQILLTQVDIEESVLEWMDTVRELIKADVNLVDRLAATPKKKERIDEYLAHLIEGLNSWREKVNGDIFEEGMTYRMVEIAKERGLDYMKVLHNPESDDFKEVFRTIVEQDAEKLTEKIEKDNL
ncbi:hypothetical protein [Lysinibacillus antri]|uniref:Uncharacterized protein n=1 Tax=Lysinibacillus antri TaxID=2498145 RepID=A0A432LD41_9BACI|nr:hypothetical protein [Lysinibacillus antri]RUL54154.1 hypothetical protein EK386_06490 [Lysinibacillus antri]